MRPESTVILINVSTFVFFQSLSRDQDGLLITEVDLNLCRQIKDFWTFRMTQRLDMYAESFKRASQLDFKPQIIRE